MAYETQYRITFKNEENREIIILLQEKDAAPPAEIQEYAATSIILTKLSANQDKLSSITPQELVMSFDIRDTDIDYWEDFVNAEKDTWKVIGTIDTKYFFHGFVVPDEGAVPFQDRPYDAKIIATDNLALLKQIPLVDFNGFDFKGEYTILSYLGCALYRTGLDLEIRVYDNVYHAAMLTRADDLKWDMVSQTKLEARTFLKDPVTFVSCYEALEIICKRGFKLSYDMGQWVIKRIGMYQFNPFPKHYTVYSSDLLSAVGFEDPGTHTLVGKHDIIYCINEDQIKTVKFPYKNVKTTFTYNVWPELPSNNKFERGDLNVPLSGVGYQSYDIDDWEHGIVGATPPFALTPTANSRAYVKKSYNAYGIEISRELIMTKEPGNNQTWLRSEGIPVVAGDKVGISFEQKFSTAVSGSGAAGIVKPAIYIYVTDGTNYRYLGDNLNNDVLRWDSFASTYVQVRHTGATTEYSSVNHESPPIPITGTLYYAFHVSGSLPAGTMVIRTGIEFKYIPYVAGGYIQVKGDYWTRSQNKNYPDVSDEEVFVSDSPKKVLKGVLLNLSDGLPTSPEWYRQGVSESRHYKELINIAEYNMLYRRFWQIEGSFNGLMYSNENAPAEFMPLSLHAVYKFNDITPEERYFMLTTPVEQDLITGHFRGTFIELNMVPEGSTPVVENIDDFLARVISTINSVNEADWNSASLAPPSGTVAFPPSAHPWTIPNTLVIAINDTDTMTYSISDGGAGNSPSITETYNADVGPYRWIQWTFGTDIAIGNEFTFTAYGHSVVVTVEGSTALASADGNQLGDSSSFNYVFK